MWWAQLLNNIVALFDSGAGGAASSFESIATATGTGSSQTITFSSIPSTYKHLQIRWIARNTATVADESIGVIAINGSTTVTDYASHYLYGNGATVSAGGYANTIVPEYGMIAKNGNTSGIMGAGIIDINDYASTTKAKTIRTLSGDDRNGGGFVGMWSGLYIPTTAISSITLYSGGTGATSTYFTTASTFALYGIKG